MVDEKSGVLMRNPGVHTVWDVRTPKSTEERKTPAPGSGAGVLAEASQA